MEIYSSPGCNKLTKENVEDAFKVLQVNVPEKREFVFMTGSLGYAMFDKAMSKHSYILFCETLHEQGKITYEEKTNLISMINSQDDENFEVAKVIIQTKKQENGRII